MSIKRSRGYQVVVQLLQYSSSVVTQETGSVIEELQNLKCLWCLDLNKIEPKNKIITKVKENSTLCWIQIQSAFKQLL